jgi:carboxypeptidase D
VALKKIAIGDGTIGSLAETIDVPTVSIIETYPQLINFDQEVYEYFRSQYASTPM